MTFLHYTEHVADIPDKRIARFKVPVLEDGARVWRDMEEVDTSSQGAHASWPDRLFSQIVDGFLAQTQNRGGQVGNAESFLFSAGALHAYALPVMHELAGSPIRP